MPAPHVVLIGMMGAGKTTVGRALAERLGRPYLDNDAALLRESGMTAAALLAARGAEALHAAEAAVLRSALATPEPLVLSAPGSVALDPSLAPLLAGAVVVWLRAAPATLAARVAAGPDRPFVSMAPESVAALAAAREPGFAALASYVVDVDTLSPAEAVDRIAGWLSTT